MRRKRSGFTLIELLVVIAIIGVLAGLLGPAVVRAKGKAQNAACQAKLKQWAFGMHIYLTDYEDVFPREDAHDGFNEWNATAEATSEDVWYNAVAKKFGTKTAAYHSQNVATRDEFFLRTSLFNCPKADFRQRNTLGPNFSLGMNSQLIFENERVTLDMVQVPTKTAIFLDLGLPGEPQLNLYQKTYSGQPKGFATLFSGRHHDGGNIAMIAGNVAWFSGARVIKVRQTGDGLAARDVFPPRDVVWCKTEEEIP